MNNTSEKLNPMFNRKKPRRPSPPVSENVRKERKQRSDKKFDIKVPLNDRQLRIFRALAYKHGMTDTAYAAYLVVKGMDYNLDFEEVEYKNFPETVHAKLTKEEHERLFQYDLIWNNRSMRKTAHRILIGMLDFLSGEVRIK
ncbi:hypothetical protein PUS82_00415 [Cytobacillus firmus]|uniref:hypothetical protein n=1 Tax=Cytobacillus firmus TaxID=1399 RepID=UPI00237A22A1|nr:hypothetical protein [Cytobacillus firmus]MDD9309794.1 hypothetical protein [Cytobacillus firmus]